MDKNLIREDGIFCTKSRNTSTNPPQYNIISIYFIGQYMILDSSVFSSPKEIEGHFIREKIENRRRFKNSLIDLDQYEPFSNIRKNVSIYNFSRSSVTGTFYSPNSDYADLEVRLVKTWSIMKGSQFVLTINRNGHYLIERSLSTFYPFS